MNDARRSRSRRSGFAVLALCLTGLAACGGVSAPELIARAEAAADEGRLRAAVIDLRSAVASDPTNAQARFMLATTALTLGDAATAEKELRRARELGYEMQPTIMPFAEALVLLGRGEEALRELEGYEPVTAAVQSLRGDAFASQGEDEPALAFYRNALELDPSDERALLGAARYALAKGDRASARTYYQRAADAHPDSAQVRLSWGRFLYASGSPAEAEEQFDAGLALPLTSQRVQDRWELLLSLCEAQLALTNLEGAEQTLATLQEIRPDHTLVKYLGARLAFENRELVEADELIARVVVEAPEFSPALLLQGTVKLARGEFAQARQPLQMVVDRNPADVQARKLLAAAERGLKGRDQGKDPAALSDGEVLSLLGDANAQTGDFGSAIVLWQRALAEDPDNATVKIELLSAYVLAGRTEEAAELIASTEWTDPEHAKRVAVLDTLLSLRAGDTDAAEKKLEASIEKYSDSVPLRSMQGLVRLRNGDLEGAKAAFEGALALDPSHTTSALNLAAIANRQGDPGKAMRLLTDFVDAYPDDALALNSLASQWLAQGDTEQARKLLERARAADPKSIPARMQLAELMARAGEFANAEVVAREVLELRPRFVGAYNTLSIAQLGQGRTEEARNTLRTALRIDPQAREPLRNLLRLEFQQGEGNQAQQTVDQLLAVDPNDLVGLEIATRLAIAARRVDEAEDLLGRLVAAAPERTALTAVVLRGDIAFTRQQFGEAVDLYGQAYARAPSAALVERLYRGRVALGQSDADLILRTWVTQNPDDFAMRLMLAQHQQASGDHAAAIANYEQILAKQEPNAAVLNNLAWAYMEVGDDRAVNTAQRALDLAPESAAIKDTYGWLLVLDGQLQNGVSLLRDAWEAAPQVGDIGYHLAEGLVRTGASAEAREVLEKVLAEAGEFPTRPQAQALLTEVSGES